MAKFSHLFLKRLTPWVVPILLIIIWQISASEGWLSTRILPAPLDVGRAAQRLLQSGDLEQYIGVSAQRALLGFLIGGTIGFLLGLVNGLFRLAETLFDTTLQMVRNVPHLALLPLVILWFGIGEEAKLFLIALGTMFPVYLNTYHGIRNVDPGLIEMGKVYRLSRWDLFHKVVLAGALPSILVGVRFAMGVTWLTLIVAETIAADSGIGYMAMNAREFMQMDIVVLSIVLYALLGKLSDSLTKALERRWLQWHPNFQKAA